MQSSLLNPLTKLSDLLGSVNTVQNRVDAVEGRVETVEQEIAPLNELVDLFITHDILDPIPIGVPGQVLSVAGRRYDWVPEAGDQTIPNPGEWWRSVRDLGWGTSNTVATNRFLRGFNGDEPNGNTFEGRQLGHRLRIIGCAMTMGEVERSGDLWFQLAGADQFSVTLSSQRSKCLFFDIEDASYLIQPTSGTMKPADGSSEAMRVQWRGPSALRSIQLWFDAVQALKPGDFWDT